MRTGPRPGTWWSRSWRWTNPPPGARPAVTWTVLCSGSRGGQPGCLNLLGDSAAQAIVIGERLVAASERVLGPDHPDTLASRNNLAIAYQAAGRLDEAISLHEQTLAARERVLGPDHPDTLNSREQPRHRLPGRGPPR